MSKPIFQAELHDAENTATGVITIPFPLPQEEYDHSIGLLTSQGLGDPVRQDCFVAAITGDWPVLKRLEGQMVNVDELDYLAKRLDSFTLGEKTQFQGMAHKLGLESIKDLINLTFCCQQATVVSNFRDLEAVGKAHLLTLNNCGLISSAEYEQTSGEAAAQALLLCGKGQTTPYGVVYDNGMVLEQLYRGQEFPPYAYDAVLVDLRIASPNEPKDAVWLGLPMLPSQIERTIRRCGMENIREFYMEADAALLSAEMLGKLRLKNESITSLNEMCMSICKLTPPELDKLWAAVTLAQPEGAYEIRQLADNLELFTFVSGVSDATQLGGYMISQSGHFEYDPNLDEYYDFEKYGQRMLERESGQFTAAGYISYQGVLSLEELMAKEPTEPEQREAEAQPRPQLAGPSVGQQMF